MPVGDGGATWNIPTNDDCNECHRGRQDRILGFEQVEPRARRRAGTDARASSPRGPRDARARGVSLTIGDDGTGLDALALGWLHVNCGVTCHNANPAAAGNGAGMLLRLDPRSSTGRAPNAATWDILKTTVNVPCVSGSLVGQPRIGRATAASAIHQLIDERGALQMPPIGSRSSTRPTSRSSRPGLRRWRPTAVRPRTAGSRSPTGAFTSRTAAFVPDGGSSEAGSPEAGAIDAGLDAGVDANDVDAGDATVTTGDDDGGDEAGE